MQVLHLTMWKNDSTNCPEIVDHYSRMSAKRRFCQPPTGVQGGRAPCVRRARLVRETCMADTARNRRCAGRSFHCSCSTFTEPDAGSVKIPFILSCGLNPALMLVNRQVAGQLLQFCSRSGKTYTICVVFTCIR